MSTLFLPQSVINKIDVQSKKNKAFTNLKTLSGSPVSFDTIKGYSTEFRDKMVRVSQFLTQQGAPDQIDLTDECVAIAIDGESIRAVLQSGTGFTNLIALLGIVDGHLTFSLLGADPANELRISPLYKQETIQGIETWPRRGLLGQTKEFKEVLDCQ
jgi:hypothetical protein